MVTEIFGPQVESVLKMASRNARDAKQIDVVVEGAPVKLRTPYPSPEDWRDCWIYFLMIDRFNNPAADPRHGWNRAYNFRQGGTFEGVREQLGYLRSLGVGAIWLSPVLKTPCPDSWEYTYPGYGIQDFLNVDERFGTEQDLVNLVNEAHARGMYVILDIVLNHTARVFDYIYRGKVVDWFSDREIMDGPLGDEPDIEWLNGFGYPRSDWKNSIPPGGILSGDDAVWPAEMRRTDFFRRRGDKLTDKAPGGGFARGDFGTMRQLVVEYAAVSPEQRQLREKYGINPVLGILIRIYSYLIAKYDIDGYRIDTVKYVDPDAIEIFGNAIREFALSIGKKNFFTFGEVYDDEQTIANFVGRNNSTIEGFGIDAALDFPTFYKLPAVIKGNLGVETVRQVFSDRKKAENELISSHGEAGRYFVSFIDNHDQNERFKHPQTPMEQVFMGMAALFCLQGIPCIYYGTEQGLDGTKNSDGSPDLGKMESVREALWGKKPKFDNNNVYYKQIQSLARLRKEEAALRYGRLYFRQVSGNGTDFGHSNGSGGILSFSRILSDREVVFIANTGFNKPFKGHVLVDYDLNRETRKMKIAYSNMNKSGSVQSEKIPGAVFYDDGGNISGKGEAASIAVELGPMEVQVLVPV
jgi:glycosidase